MVLVVVVVVVVAILQQHMHRPIGIHSILKYFVSYTTCSKYAVPTISNHVPKYCGSRLNRTIIVRLQMSTGLLHHQHPMHPSYCYLFGPFFIMAASGLDLDFHATQVRQNACLGSQHRVHIHGIRPAHITSIIVELASTLADQPARYRRMTILGR